MESPCCPVCLQYIGSHFSHFIHRPISRDYFLTSTTQFRHCFDDATFWPSDFIKCRELKKIFFFLLIFLDRK